MAKLLRPNCYKLSEYADKSAFWNKYEEDTFVRCCFCKIPIKPETLETHFHYCEFCQTIPTSLGNMVATFFIKKVVSTNKRTELVGLPSTLTPPQWVRCLEFFKFTCAYCAGTWTCCEHFIPIAQGGGTTVQNILPACHSCNMRKRAKTFLPNLSKIYMNKIQEYFALPDLDNPPLQYNPMYVFNRLRIKPFMGTVRHKNLILGHPVNADDMADDVIFVY